MSEKPVLLVMAAGMGSRYGGLKQIDPIGPCGEIIIDYSMFDARRAGFETVVFIIKHEIEKDFKAIIERGAGRYMNVKYVYQDINDIPDGFRIPEDRKKPWGTAHAVLAAKPAINGPFLVINADDYYGPGVFKSMYDYLSKANDSEYYDYCMAGYYIENTLTENGSVARGICVEKDGYLSEIRERTRVQRNDGLIQFSEDDGKSWTTVPEHTPVSMNCFGFTHSIFAELEKRLPGAIEKILAENPLKGEFYIPIVTGELVNEGLAKVKVLPADDKWYGVTYREDRESIVSAMKAKVEDGIYPEKLWP